MPNPIVEREALMFEAGDYPDKGINVTDADLDAIIANTPADVPVKLEHVNTPLDGAMGTVTKLWRKGHELWGKIAFPEPMWNVVTAARAFRLSVGIGGFNDLPKLEEVSIVRNPRVASARVFRFSADGIGFNGFVVQLGLGPLSISDVMSRLYDILNPDPDVSYAWIEDLYEDSVVISDGTRTHKRDLDVSDDGEITLGDPVEVRRDWIPIKAQSEPASAFRNDTINERNQNMADETTITMTAAELDAKLADATVQAKAEAAREAEAQAELEAKHDARATAMILATDGKVSADMVQHCETIIMAGEPARDALTAILDGIHAAQTAQPVSSTDEASRLFAALGVTAEQVEKHRERGS